MGYFRGGLLFAIRRVSVFSSSLYEQSMEKLVMHWHLSNALIWSGMCDVLSGLFGVIPKLSVIYWKLDTRHMMDDDMRSGLDACYWTEVPLFKHH